MLEQKIELEIERHCPYCVRLHTFYEVDFQNNTPIYECKYVGYKLDLNFLDIYHQAVQESKE